MKLSTSTSELLAQLQTVTRVASTRSAVQALSGVQIAAGGTATARRAARHRHGGRPARPARRPRSSARATVVLPARLLLDVVRTLRSGDVSLELRPTEQDVEVVGGTARFHIRTLRAEDFPPLPGAGRRPGRRDAGAGVRRDDRPRVALGLARRDAPDPHRHPRVRVGRRAADGRHRLLPAEREGDPARGAAGGRLRGQRAGARARGARAPGRATTSRRSGSACARTRSSSRSAASCSPRG